MTKNMAPAQMCDRLNDAMQKLLLLDEVFCSGIDTSLCSSGLAYVVHGIVDDVQGVYQTIDAMRESDQRTKACASS